MRNAGRLIDILDRMESGPVMDEKEFDMKVVAARTAELAREYEMLSTVRRSSTPTTRWRIAVSRPGCNWPRTPVSIARPTTAACSGRERRSWRPSSGLLRPWSSARAGMLIACTGATRRIRGGRRSGLEARYNGEVGLAVAGMSRDKANDIVARAVPEYVDLLDSEPKGKRFDQAYDMHTLRPTPEWDALYREVKDEVAGFGVPFG